MYMYRCTCTGVQVHVYRYRCTDTGVQVQVYRYRCTGAGVVFHTNNYSSVETASAPKASAEAEAKVGYTTAGY